jgi:enoyl-CoA hydratase
VIRGAGGTFCSGADRATIAQAVEDPTRDDIYRDIGLVYECFARVDALATPTVAAVRGWAVGAGLNLALAADLRVVSRTAVLRSGFRRIGIHPGGGHLTLAARAGGRELAAAMAVFGCDVNGEEAVRLGLAWESTEDDAVDARALELADGAAADPALARETIRHLRMEAAGHFEVRAATELERAAQLWSFRRRGRAG